MANHKRKRPKNRRAGCIMCKYWKMNGAPKRWHFKGSELRRMQDKPEKEAA